jgi:hypothetical protein
MNFNNAMTSPGGSLGAIYQEGTNNFAEQSVEGPGVDLSVEQIGDNNRATQSASTSGNWSGAYGYIVQHQNNANAVQFVSSIDGYGEINQMSIDPAASNYNEQEATELGKAIANVYGPNNYGKQNVARFGEARIEEHGTHNSSTLLISEYSGGYIETGVLSAYNTMLIDQTSGGVFSTSESSASIYVKGLYNEAEILQNGNMNKATGDGYGIEIKGNFNSGSIKQVGDNNNASLQILGNNINTSIEQMGNFLTTNIIQEN